MPTLSESAIDIIKAVHKELTEKQEPNDRYAISKLLDTYPNIVFNALNIPSFEMGTVTARRILRAYIAYEDAKRRKETLEVVHNNMKYKGTREVSGRRKGKGTWGKEM